VTLLERALATAQAAGIRRYVVVVGSLDGPVASFCRRRRPDVEVVCAPDHACGTGTTVVAGLAHAGGRCLVMMVDHLHEPWTLERVLGADGELVFAVDSRAAYVDPGEATLVRREHGAVVAIDKGLRFGDATAVRDAPAPDDDQERRGRRLLLGKGAVLAHRFANPLAAESDESRQRRGSSKATRRPLSR
jgi:choline kinase